MPVVGRDRPLIGVAGLIDRGRLELVAELEPLGCRPLDSAGRRWRRLRRRAARAARREANEITVAPAGGLPEASKSRRICPESRSAGRERCALRLIASDGYLREDLAAALGGARRAAGGLALVLGSGAIGDLGRPRSRALDGLAAPAATTAATAAEARLERLHQVDDLRLGRLVDGRHHFLALDLLLDRGQDRAREPRRRTCSRRTGRRRSAR